MYSHIPGHQTLTYYPTKEQKIELVYGLVAPNVGGDFSPKMAPNAFVVGCVLAAGVFGEGEGNAKRPGVVERPGRGVWEG